jgi:hypothetical protein
MDEHGGHRNLRGLSHRSVIPYIYGEWCCIVVLLKPWLEWDLNGLLWS